MRYETLSNHSLNKLMSESRIDAQYKEIYAYSLVKLMAGVINTILLIIAATLFDIRLATFIFIVFYMPIRKFAGGLHAKTRIRCVVLSLLTMIALIKISELLIQIKHWNVIVLTLILIANILVFKYAPVDSENNRLSLENRKKHKMISRKITILDSMLILISMIFLPQINSCIMTATMAVALVGFTLIPYKKI